ncbi:flagellar hook-basal body complex protein FliE [Sandaracinobacteroides sp. A072]|uniref:flagellar hook-basal body complex protein FliE n=1 Tax=Sandaracinobacteroides sp. A072 TaxID=3461146 RepID=UPI00404242A6
MNGIDRSLGLSGVLALRASILERATHLSAPLAAPAAALKGQAGRDGGGFGAAMTEAIAAVNGQQARSAAASAAWERGETHDIAAVMLERQKASIAFEATLQARNRLLSAYRDIMNMPV